MNFTKRSLPTPFSTAMIYAIETQRLLALASLRVREICRSDSRSRFFAFARSLADLRPGQRDRSERRDQRAADRTICSAPVRVVISGTGASGDVTYIIRERWIIVIVIFAESACSRLAQFRGGDDRRLR